MTFSNASLHKWRLRIAFLIGCFLISGVSAFASIALELKAPKNACLLDESMYITATLHNTGESNVKVMSQLELGAGILNMNISVPGERTHQLVPWVQIGLASTSITAGMINLVPKGSYSTSLDITYNIEKGNKQTVFHKTGIYELQCVYTPFAGFGLDAKSTYSNKVRIQVETPSDDNRSAHAALLKGPRATTSGIWSAHRDWIPVYEDCLKKYPASVYTTYARFYLAQCYENRTGYSSLRKAAELYTQTASEFHGTALSPYALRLAGRSYAKLGKPDNAVTSMIGSFTSKDSTDDDRFETLSWIKLIGSGLFQQEEGIIKGTGGYEVWIPLDAFASSIGYTVKWNRPKKLVDLSYSRISGTLDQSKGMLTMSKGRTVKARVQIDNGSVMVSPATFAVLMSAKYGREI